jgi:hypothetical protein
VIWLAPVGAAGAASDLASIKFEIEEIAGSIHDGGLQSSRAVSVRRRASWRNCQKYNPALVLTLDCYVPSKLTLGDLLVYVNVALRSGSHARFSARRLRSPHPRRGRSRLYLAGRVGAEPGSCGAGYPEESARARLEAREAVSC